MSIRREAGSSTRPGGSAAGSESSSGAGSKRPRDRERTIEAILNTAEKLVEEKGPDGFGLAELGRQAGISFGLIHHYFGGKEGLLKAVLRRTLREMGAEVRRLQEDGTFWSKDAPAVLMVFDTFAKRPALARLTAWGLLTGLIGPEDVASEFHADAEALGSMIDAFRKEAPDLSGNDAAGITTLLMSAVLGFNLLRPLLASTVAWGEDEDAKLRAQLARVIVGLAHPKQK